MRHLKEAEACGHYPLRKRKCLVSHGVTVLRESEAKGYRLIKKPFRITVVSCSIRRNPRLQWGRPIYKDYGVTKETTGVVQALLRTIKEAHCDYNILSALGCGAYGHPPEMVASIFRDQLNYYPTPRLHFAIIDDHNTGKSHNKDGNVTPFKRILDGYQQNDGVW